MDTMASVATLSSWDRLRRALGLPTSPEKAARARFRDERPGEPVAWTTLAADEPERWVAGVFYGTTRPPQYRFYAVDKRTGHVLALADDSAYRPRGWR